MTMATPRFRFAEVNSYGETRWVELPACPVPVTAADVPLAEDLHNASKATCKTLRTGHEIRKEVAPTAPTAGTPKYVWSPT